MNPRIVVIEDDSVNLQACLLLLSERLKYSQVRGFSHPKSFLKKTDLENVDIVISDNEMPEIGGGELCAQIKAAHPHIFFILMSGDLNPLRVEKVFSASNMCIDAFMSKPIDLKELETYMNMFLYMPESFRDNVAIYRRMTGDIELINRHDFKIVRYRV